MALVGLAARKGKSSQFVTCESRAQSEQPGGQAWLTWEARYSSCSLRTSISGAGTM